MDILLMKQRVLSKILDFKRFLLTFVRGFINNIAELLTKMSKTQVLSCTRNKSI